MARTSEAILAAATGAFAERGYAGVGLEQVAAMAGVTRGAVYHRYAAKRELFLAVLEASMAKVADRIEAAAETAGDDLVRQLELGAEAFVRTAISPDVRRILLIDGPAVAGWESWRGLDARHSRRTLEAALGELHRRGGLSELDPQAIAVLLSGALNEGALWAADSDDPEGAIPAVIAGFRRLVGSLFEP